MYRSSRLHNQDARRRTDGGLISPLPSSFISPPYSNSVPGPSFAHMPPAHVHTTIYVPVVSPPTPAPSPGPIESFDLLPSPGTSPTSSSTSEIYHQHRRRSSTSDSGSNEVDGPPTLRKEFLSSLLASCTPEELLFISATIAPRLKRDFLFSLPTELALYVLSFIEDPKTLGRAESVSHRWRTLVREEGVWRKMCEMWGFDDWNNADYEDEEEEDDPFDDDPLEDMEQFANFPMDPALEWLITKRRQELGGKKKGKHREFCFRTHFRTCYITMMNWRKGGNLLRSHRIPVVTPESGVVTSLALDADWVVIGLANSRIQVYSAKTGVLAKTLVGHELGVWSVCLVSKGGWMVEREGIDEGVTSSSPGSTPSHASSSPYSSLDDLTITNHHPRRRSSQTAAAEPRGSLRSGIPRLSLDNSPLQSPPLTTPSAGRHSSGRRRASRSGSGPFTPSSSLEHLVPASLRVAIGLDPPTAGDEDDVGGSTDKRLSHQRNWDNGHDDHSDGAGEDVFPFPSNPFPNQKQKSKSKGGTRPQTQRKYSDMCHSSTGWGQPNSIVVSGGCDKVIMVWDVKTGHCIYRLSGHTSTIRCIRVLQNRPIAVSGSRDSTLRVWDIQRGKCLRVLRGHQQSVRCIDVSGNRVVSGSYDTTCRVWDVDTGECLHVLEGHFHQIYSVAFDGRYIASGGLDTTVRLWDADSGNCIALLQGHTALVCQLQLSPTLLITGGSDGRVITFSLDTLTISHRIAAHDCSVTSLQFVDEGGNGGWYRGGEGSRGNKLNNDQSSSSSSPSALTNPNLDLDLSRDRHAPSPSHSPGFLVTGGNDGRVRLYEVETGNYVRDVSEGGESVWRVCVGWGVCVVVCKRGGKTVVEIWSMRPEEGEQQQGGGGKSVKHVIGQDERGGATGRGSVSVGDENHWPIN